MVIVRTKDSNILKIYPPAHSEGKHHLNFPLGEFEIKYLSWILPEKVVFIQQILAKTFFVCLKHSGTI